ncbi:twin-arginine translocase subunit TatC [Kamptonema cortianum]|nr:twin-arginine translocase subunit TatC [Kamptonema cortianum]MDL5049733.1 twin-arginine translocase subunit TatC [Oscillatoria amoena NRMC-F 0135]
MDEESKPFFDRGQYKTFLEHLDDLRGTLLKMSAALVVGMVLAFVFAEQLVAVYLWPLSKVEGIEDPREFLLNLGVIDPLSMILKLSFYGGMVLAAPFILYFLGEFLLPALTKKERTYVLPGVGAGFLLFLAGVSFAYFWLLPITLEFFSALSTKLGFVSRWSMIEYFSFVSNFLLAFGLSFQLPIVILVLNRLGVLPARLLRQGRRYAFLIIVVLSAMITPTSDAFTLMAMSIPLYVLYEISVWVALWRERKLRGVEQE